MGMELRGSCSILLRLRVAVWSPCCPLNCPWIFGRCVSPALGTTSKRRLLEEVRLHLAYRWFTRPDFGQEVPDPSTFTELN